MPTAPQTQAQTIVLGAGYVYFEENDASGNATTGRRYLGDSPSMTVTGGTERLEVYDSDGPTAEKIVDLTTRLSRNASLTVRDQSGDNLGVFLMGDTSTVTQTATPVADEAIAAVQQGRYYQLGRSVANPSGVKGIGSVTVTDDVPSAPFTVNDDYVVYAAEGMLYIVPGGAISDDTNLLVDYTPAANSRTRVTTNNDGTKQGELTYVEDNTAGENKVWTFPLVELAPNGDLALKSRDSIREMPFSVAINTRSGYEQIYCDGEPV